MTVLIIEDEPQAVQRLTTLLREVAPEMTVLATLDSVKSAVTWFSNHAAPDLTLMDIQLADGISFQIFEQCKVETPVIFTTAYNEYALKAFKVNSIDYLLKPIDKTEFAAALKKFTSLNDQAKGSSARMLESIGAAMHMLTKRYKERFVIKVGEHLRSVEIQDIIFFFSQEKATFAQTRDGRKHVIDFTMDQLTEIVDPGRFFRINRKYLVAADAIKDMISYTNSRLRLVLSGTDETDAVVARERVQEFKSWLDR